MTHADEKPRAVPYIEEADLVFLAADLGFGYFPAAELYHWHSMQLEEFNKREGTNRLPVSKKQFGLALAAHGWQKSIRTIGGQQKRCWLINKPWARRGAAMLADELAASQKQEADRALST